MDCLSRSFQKLSTSALVNRSSFHTSTINYWRNPRNKNVFFRPKKSHSSQFPTEFTSVEPRKLKITESALPKEFLDYPQKFPEFLPVTDLRYRQPLKDAIEREEMLKRRFKIEIPAVVVSDPYAIGKVSKFVGICIARYGQGLNACFTLRNVIENEGVEIIYELYNPTIKSIEVLKLEKRLDDHLMYLRDAPLHYSEVPFDLMPEMRLDSDPVPLNPIQVKLNPHPWSVNWSAHFHELKGIQGLEQVQESRFLKGQKNVNKLEKYDLMKQYRENIPEEDQLEIWQKVKLHTQSLEKQRRDERRKRFLKID